MRWPPDRETGPSMSPSGAADRSGLAAPSCDPEQVTTARVSLVGGRADRSLERCEVELASLAAEGTEGVRPSVRQRRQALQLNVPADLASVRVETGMSADRSE
jgi:hypothetical protein